MKQNIVKLIKAGKLFEARKAILEAAEDIQEELLEEYKSWYLGFVLSEGRFKIVRVRIRKGKVQRRKKVATIKNYTMRGGKLTRMSSVERRNRKIGARRGKVKRKAKKARALMRRKRSMRKLKAVGGGRR